MGFNSGFKGLIAKLSIRVYLLFHDFNMSGVLRQIIKLNVTCSLYDYRNPMQKLDKLLLCPEVSQALNIARIQGALA